MCLARITINTVPKVIHRANQLREQYEGLDEPAGDGVNQFTNLSPTVGVKSIRRGSGGVPGQTKILGLVRENRLPGPLSDLHGRFEAPRLDGQHGAINLA
jgi:hypothetical protein